MLRCTLSAFLLNLVNYRDVLAADTILATVAAILVAIGLWTPIAGALAALSLVWGGISNPGLWPCILTAPIGIALSLVGPGAISIDARIYGRKRVVFDDRRD